LRYPEREFVSIPATREYLVPIRPISIPEADRVAVNRFSTMSWISMMSLESGSLKHASIAPLLIRKENYRFAAADPDFILATPFLELAVADESAVESARQWEAAQGWGSV
jgi:hypothetical protein